FFFFFSSRRRHTRSYGDWSSDVCSSDLADSGQQAILEEALAAAAGVVIDGFADDGIVIPGERVQVETSVWNAGDARLTLDGIELSAPAGWRVERLDAMSSPVPRGTLATRRFAVTVAADAPRSQAYFLRRPLVGALYDWSGVPAAWRGLSFEPPPVQMTMRLTIAGQPLTLSREVVYRYRDQGTGEVRRPLFVTRPFDVAVAPDLVVWPVDGTAGGLRHFTITVTNRTRGPAVARIALTTPPGWTTLRPDSLSFEREDESKSLSITLAPPASLRPGEYELKAA